MIALLHNIRSAHNVGSIFRTADAVGITKLYLCGITPAPLDKYKQPVQKIAKVSLGAEQNVAWEQRKSTMEVMADLKKQNYQLLAIEQASNSIPYHQLQLSTAKLAKTALIVGNELEGLPTEIIDKADKILEIPMQGQKESLNVSVAFGIVAFALRDKRGLSLNTLSLRNFSILRQNR
ncbi:MAG: TrmH family RNA methyltransferase [Parcubacteria group bacterium]|nr:TrmH family RNA methyltransferase [Parcubacteria group bacterium]